MKKALFLNTILFFLSCSVFALTEEGLFNKIKNKNDAYLPASYKASVSSPDITRSLLEIPQRSRRGRMYAEFLFHKKYGQRIVVRNVEEIYKDRFAVYLTMYNQFKIFLKKDSSYPLFTRKYIWKIRGTTGSDYIIFMKKIRSSAKDYFLMYIDKRSLLINKVIRHSSSGADYYSIKYKKHASYIVPASFTYNGIIKGKRKVLTFYFTNIKINAPLRENDFLD
jgi:hypothetical protein